ncbi:MAG: pyridoxamine 5'-phosphate oxidase [Alphaproteobacteria bacterium]|nr:pyridoxamine 5'-phosphate oxidase [Alphaproteobacteria bacterium]
MDFLPFHRDEITAQSLAGHVAKGRAAIRPFMPDQHREFFALLPYLFTATLDQRGWPMASLLSGRAGFAHSPDPATLRIDALPAPDDPAASGFAVGAPIGVIGLDFTTRRRNRLNGRIAATDAGGLGVEVEQSFGNCPQYIQRRLPTERPKAANAVEPLAGLDEAARRTISAADTLFVASRSRPEAGPDGGLDMSHRGGNPGFVGIEGDTLVIPDFRGNRTACIDWHPQDAPVGAERSWRLRVERAWRRRDALPFTWRFGDSAPTTLATGTWSRT